MSSNNHNNFAGTGPSSLRLLARSAFAVGAMLVSGIAVAAAADMSEAQARHQRDRATCISGQSHQDRTTCLREADAALAESKRGNLDAAGTGHYEQNQLLRCDAHAAEDREDCLRRMRGEGTISGSVEGGGLYRELRTTTPVN
jgi:hypothetical protein